MARFHPGAGPSGPATAQLLLLGFFGQSACWLRDPVVPVLPDRTCTRSHSSLGSRMARPRGRLGATVEPRPIIGSATSQTRAVGSCRSLTVTRPVSRSAARAISSTAAARRSVLLQQLSLSNRAGDVWASPDLKWESRRRRLHRGCVDSSGRRQGLTTAISAVRGDGRRRCRRHRG
jgi:hypothetical protein